MPETHLLDLNLGYNYHGIQFGISLLNVLDENYESPHGFSQEGRKFTLGFNKSFWSWQKPKCIIKYSEGETMIKEALIKKLEGDVEVAKVDLRTFLANPIGVAEHIDYVITAEKKLEALANAEDKLNSIKNL